MDILAMLANALALYLVSRSGPQSFWGPRMGLLAQAGWLIYGVQVGSMGCIGAGLLYGAVYLQALWRQWRGNGLRASKAVVPGPPCDLQ